MIFAKTDWAPWVTAGTAFLGVLLGAIVTMIGQWLQRQHERNVRRLDLEHQGRQERLKVYGAYLVEAELVRGLAAGTVASRGLSDSGDQEWAQRLLAARSMVTLVAHPATAAEMAPLMNVVTMFMNFVQVTTAPADRRFRDAIYAQAEREDLFDPASWEGPFERFVAAAQADSAPLR